MSESIITGLSWHLVKPKGGEQLFVPRTGHTATFLGTREQKILVFGGKGKGGILYNDVCCFDLQTNTWSKPKVQGIPPEPRYRHDANRSNQGNVIVIYGGYVKQKGHVEKNSTDCYILDMSGRRGWCWSKVEFGNFRVDVRSFTSCCFEEPGLLHVIAAEALTVGHHGKVSGRASVQATSGARRGSRVGLARTKAAYFRIRLDPISWNVVCVEQPILSGEAFQSRSYFTTVTSRLRQDHRILCFGGKDGITEYNDLQSLSTTKGTWAEMKTHNQIRPRCRHSCVCLGERWLVVFGGEGSNGSLNDLAILDLNQNELSWTSIRNAQMKSGCFWPIARQGHAAVIISELISPTTPESHQQHQLNSRRRIHSSLKHRMYVFGGMSGSTPHSDVCYLDLSPLIHGNVIRRVRSALAIRTPLSLCTEGPEIVTITMEERLRQNMLSKDKIDFVTSAQESNGIDNNTNGTKSGVIERQRQKKVHGHNETSKHITAAALSTASIDRNVTAKKILERSGISSPETTFDHPSKASRFADLPSYAGRALIGPTTLHRASTMDSAQWSDSKLGITSDTYTEHNTDIKSTSVKTFKSEDAIHGTRSKMRLKFDTVGEYTNTNGHDDVVGSSLFITQHSSPVKTRRQTKSRRKMISQSADTVSMRHMLATQMREETQNLKQAKKTHGALALSISHLANGIAEQKDELESITRARKRQELLLEDVNKRLAFAQEDGLRKEQVIKSDRAVLSALRNEVDKMQDENMELLAKKLRLGQEIQNLLSTAANELEHRGISNGIGEDRVQRQQGQDAVSADVNYDHRTQDCSKGRGAKGLRMKEEDQNEAHGKVDNRFTLNDGQSQRHGKTDDEIRQRMSDVEGIDIPGKNLMKKRIKSEAMNEQNQRDPSEHINCSQSYVQKSLMGSRSVGSTYDLPPPGYFQAME